MTTNRTPRRSGPRALTPAAAYGLLPELFRLRYSALARDMHARLELDAAPRAKRGASAEVDPPTYPAIVAEAQAIVRDAEAIIGVQPSGGVPSPQPSPSKDEAKSKPTPTPEPEPQVLVPPGFVPHRDLGHRVRSFLRMQIVPITKVLGQGASVEVAAAKKEKPKLAKLQVDLDAAVPEDVRTYRTSYNVACFWSGVAVHLGKERAQALQGSFDALRTCLSTAPPIEAAALARKVPDDPSLATLRSDEDFAPRVRRLLAVYAPAATGPGATELADLDAIGATAALLFARAELRTVGDITEDTTVETLAAVLGHPDLAEVARWHAAIDLLHAGIPDAGSVNLLAKAKVTSVDVLAEQDAEALRKALVAIDADAAPKLEVLDHWIARAARRRDATAADNSEDALALLVARMEERDDTDVGDLSDLIADDADEEGTSTPPLTAERQANLRERAHTLDLHADDDGPSDDGRSDDAGPPSEP